jgi:hypothetical protein
MANGIRALRRIGALTVGWVITGNTVLYQLERSSAFAGQTTVLSKPVKRRAAAFAVTLCDQAYYLPPQLFNTPGHVLTSQAAMCSRAATQMSAASSCQAHQPLFCKVLSAHPSPVQRTALQGAARSARWQGT